MKKFFSIPIYTKKQLHGKGNSVPSHWISNNYYMLLFGKFRKKEKMAKTYKMLSDKPKYQKQTIPKYFEKRHGFYYFFLNDKRYGTYHDAYLAWKQAGFKELHIVKFDKHNRFIEVVKRRRE